MPLVSVIIPTYNRRDLVQKTIDSVLAQTLTSYEVIVVDDGSSDDTGEALAARYGNRIHYMYQENQGESIAFNRGLEVAGGEYVATLGSDDLWRPEKLVRQVAVLESVPNACMTWCQAWLIDGHGQLLDTPILGAELQPSDYALETLLLRNNVSGGGSTCLIRRPMLEAVGGFDPKIRFGEDWDLWLRLRARWELAFLAEPLAYIRRHVDTQCHLPRPENVERALLDHLYLLEKAFDSLSHLPAEKAHLRKQSVARQYGEAAFASCAWGRYNQGSQWLAKAVALDPATWGVPTKLLTMLVNMGVAIAAIEGGLCRERLQTYVEETMAHWPDEVALPPHAHRQVLGRLYAEAGYLSYLSRDYAPARQFMGQALWANPALWRDWGLVKRLLVSSIRAER